MPLLFDECRQSLLNRTHSTMIGREWVGQGEEPSCHRRRLDDTAAAEVKRYLAGLKRKQMLLRQDRCVVHVKAIVVEMFS